MLVGWPGGSWEDTARLLAVVLGAYAGIVWLSAVFWTYRDARERVRDSASQTVAVLLVLLFNVAGLLLYLILRPRETLTEAYERSLEAEALLQELQDQQTCPRCRRRIEDDFIVCPYCRTPLREPCAECGKALNFAWSACPYCGAGRAKPAAATASAGPAAMPPVPSAPEPIWEGLGAPTASVPEPANPRPDPDQEEERRAHPLAPDRRFRRQRSASVPPKTEPLS